MMVKGWAKASFTLAGARDQCLLWAARWLADQFTLDVRALMKRGSGSISTSSEKFDYSLRIFRGRMHEVEKWTVSHRGVAGESFRVMLGVTTIMGETQFSIESSFDPRERYAFFGAKALLNFLALVPNTSPLSTSGAPDLREASYGNDPAIEPAVLLFRLRRLLDRRSSKDEFPFWETLEREAAVFTDIARTDFLCGSAAGRTLLKSTREGEGESAALAAPIIDMKTAEGIARRYGFNHAPDLTEEVLEDLRAFRLKSITSYNVARSWAPAELKIGPEDDFIYPLLEPRERWFEREQMKAFEECQTPEDGDAAKESSLSSAAAEENFSENAGSSCSAASRPASASSDLDAVPAASANPAASAGAAGYPNRKARRRAGERKKDTAIARMRRRMAEQMGRKARGEKSKSKKLEALSQGLGCPVTGSFFELLDKANRAGMRKAFFAAARSDYAGMLEARECEARRVANREKRKAAEAAAREKRDALRERAIEEAGQKDKEVPEVRDVRQEQRGLEVTEAPDSLEAPDEFNVNMDAVGRMEGIEDIDADPACTVNIGGNDVSDVSDVSNVHAEHSGATEASDVHGEHAVHVGSADVHVEHAPQSKASPHPAEWECLALRKELEELRARIHAETEKTESWKRAYRAVRAQKGRLVLSALETPAGNAVHPDERNEREGRSPTELLDRLFSTPEREPTPSECLELIEALHGDRVTVLEEARESARECGDFRAGRRLLSLLVRLATAYVDALAKDGDSAAKSVFTPYEFAPQEADRTLASKEKVRRRSTVWKGRTLFFRRHLRVQSRAGEKTALRVYFDWVPEEHRVVIGRCGSHFERNIR